MSMDVYQVQIIGENAGEQCENVLHFQGGVSSSSTPDADALSLISSLQSLVRTAYLTCVCSDYILGGWRAKRVNNTGGPEVSVVDSASGTYAGTVSSTQQCGLLVGPYYDSGAAPPPSHAKPMWRTTRIFMPTPPSTAIVDNDYSSVYSGYLSALCGLLNGPLGITSPGPWQYGAWSRKETAFYSILTLQTSLLVGTQRRRLHPVI
jgi:hypothetical protein